MNNRYLSLPTSRRHINELTILNRTRWIDDASSSFIVIENETRTIFVAGVDECSATNHILLPCCTRSAGHWQRDRVFVSRLILSSVSPNDYPSLPLPLLSSPFLLTHGRRMEGRDTHVGREKPLLAREGPLGAIILPVGRRGRRE